MNNNNNRNANVRVNSNSISITQIVGMLFAGYLSHQLGNSIGWVAVHAIFSWFYILYLCGGCGGGIPDGTF